MTSHPKSPRTTENEAERRGRLRTRLSQRRVVYWVNDVPGPNSSRPQPRTQASSRYLNDQRLTRG